jgi:hypothetical protein
MNKGSHGALGGLFCGAFPDWVRFAKVEIDADISGQNRVVGQFEILRS